MTFLTYINPSVDIGFNDYKTLNAQNVLYGKNDAQLKKILEERATGNISGKQHDYKFLQKNLKRF